MEELTYDNRWWVWYYFSQGCNKVFIYYNTRRGYSIFPVRLSKHYKGTLLYVVGLKGEFRYLSYK